jgi:hypothetical protein
MRHPLKPIAKCSTWQSAMLIVYFKHNQMSQLQNVPFYPISASAKNFNPQNILYILPVKIFVFLELEQN